ncbi:MAG: hypothetical protein B6D61_02810 [Bacteroidetes bacterium 4484_249]|nr:MAG: hypothetical protein B6D61_02810 [Bacteroidetes bacterium 4484_249]
MVSVQGIYDGKYLKLFENIEVNSPKRIIITFLDEGSIENISKDDIDSKYLHLIAEKGGAFDFLNNIEDDIYSDKDLKIKYKK